MKFDIVIIADDLIRLSMNNLTFLSLIGVIVAFNRKRYDDVVMTIKTTENETTSNG